MHPFEACAGFFMGTELLGIVWAKNEDEAYKLAIKKFGKQIDTDGSECLFVREPLPNRIEIYTREKAALDARLATAEPLKRVYRRVQRARQKLQKSRPKTSGNVINLTYREASIYSIVEKWLREEIKEIEE